MENTHHSCGNRERRRGEAEAPSESGAALAAGEHPLGERSAHPAIANLEKQLGPKQLAALVGALQPSAGHARPAGGSGGGGGGGLLIDGFIVPPSILRVHITPSCSTEPSRRCFRAVLGARAGCASQANKSSCRVRLSLTKSPTRILYQFCAVLQIKGDVQTPGEGEHTQNDGTEALVSRVRGGATDEGAAPSSPPSMLSLGKLCNSNPPPPSHALPCAWLYSARINERRLCDCQVDSSSGDKT